MLGTSETVFDKFQLKRSGKHWETFRKHVLREQEIVMLSEYVSEVESFRKHIVNAILIKRFNRKDFESHQRFDVVCKVEGVFETISMRYKQGSSELAIIKLYLCWQWIESWLGIILLHLMTTSIRYYQKCIEIDKIQSKRYNSVLYIASKTVYDLSWTWK